LETPVCALLVFLDLLKRQAKSHRREPVAANLPHPAGPGGVLLRRRAEPYQGDVSKIVTVAWTSRRSRSSTSLSASCRRSKGHAQSVIQTGGLVVNLDTKTVEVNGSRVHLTGRSSPMTWRESRSHRQATGPFPSPGAYPVPCERLVCPRVHLAPASRRWPGPFFWVIAAARTKNQAARLGDARLALLLFFFGHDARSGRQLQHSRLLIFAQTRE
jgi:hypothetical protein